MEAICFQAPGTGHRVAGDPARELRTDATISSVKRIGILDPTLSGDLQGALIWGCL